MAVGDFFGGLKNKVRTAYNNFFYNGGGAPAPQMQEEYQGVQEQPYPQGAQWQQPQYSAAQAPQQPVYQQPVYQQPVYQQPYQQAAYQQSAAGQQPPYQQPQAQQPRGKRMQHRAVQQESNVVDFGAYQQNQNQAAQAAQTAQPAQGNGSQPVQDNASLLSARVINARSMGDCRSAITLLRSGDAVVIVLESITDPMEMRRLVDTLSGACYSLTATITKVSRYGVYLLAPQTLAVYTDQATNMMNSAPARTQARGYQPGYAGQRPTYTAPVQQPQMQQAPMQQAPMQGQSPYAAPQQGFTQRMAAQEENTQSFYQRPTPQMAQTPSFSAAQVTGYGYAPDEAAASDQ